MAKKTVSAPPADTPAVPKKTKKAIPSIPCALVYYWEYALLAWGYCLRNLSSFAAGSPRFTENFVNDQINLVRETRGLPNQKTRNAIPREVLLSLQAARQVVADMATRLKKAINYSYEDAALAAKVKTLQARLSEIEKETNAAMTRLVAAQSRRE